MIRFLFFGPQNDRMTTDNYVCLKVIYAKYSKHCPYQEFRREGWTEKRLAVSFCLGSGLFGSYNSD